MELWKNGRMESWNVGMLECWNVGMEEDNGNGEEWKEKILNRGFKQYYKGVILLCVTQSVLCDPLWFSSLRFYYKVTLSSHKHKGFWDSSIKTSRSGPDHHSPLQERQFLLSALSFSAL